MLTSIIDELPDAFPLTVLVVMVLGFPLALGLAWACQVAEKGVERIPAAEGGASSRTAFASGLAVGDLFGVTDQNLELAMRNPAALPDYVPDDFLPFVEAGL